MSENINDKINEDSAVQKMDKLCRIRSFWRPPSYETEEENETEAANFIADYLEELKWLEIKINEVDRGRPNIIALDSAPQNIELLIVGHIDTVPPSTDWTVKEFSINDGKYYALGAGDTKGSLAAVLDAIKKVGPTKGIGYLFYVDEEYDFEGMRNFARSYPSIRPKTIFSVCGASESFLTGCRGCVEVSFVIRGHGTHATKTNQGRNAIRATNYVLEKLTQWCDTQNEPYVTSCNIASMHGGTLASSTIPKLKSGDHPNKGIPKMIESATKVPNIAWAHVDIRPGNQFVNAASIQSKVEEALLEWNKEMNNKFGKQKDAQLEEFYTRFEVKGFVSPEHVCNQVIEDFVEVHKGKIGSASEFGYVDIAMLASRDPKCCGIMLSPKKGNEHASDEWIDIESLKTYRDCVIKLISRYLRKD